MQNPSKVDERVGDLPFLEAGSRRVGRIAEPWRVYLRKGKKGLPTRSEAEAARRPVCTREASEPGGQKRLHLRTAEVDDAIEPHQLSSSKKEVEHSSATADIAAIEVRLQTMHPREVEIGRSKTVSL
jgi:hypothetical protein